MKVSNIITSLIIITILFVFFVGFSYFLGNLVHNRGKNESLTIKSRDSLVINLTNNLPLSDKLALDNEKNSVSDKIFNNVKFEVVNNEKYDLDYELYITKDELKDNEIKGKYIKFFLQKQNGDEIKGYSKEFIPNYDNLSAISDLPGSRILYKGTIKGNSVEKFSFKTWISDDYKNYNVKEEFNYSIHIRVI